MTAESAPRPDDIAGLMIKYLSEESQKVLLKALSSSSHINTLKTKEINLPFAKLSKDLAVPENYRPVSCTSCISKLMEEWSTAS